MLNESTATVCHDYEAMTTTVASPAKEEEGEKEAEKDLNESDDEEEDSFDLLDDVTNSVTSHLIITKVD